GPADREVAVLMAPQLRGAALHAEQLQREPAAVGLIERRRGDPVALEQPAHRRTRRRPQSSMRCAVANSSPRTASSIASTVWPFRVAAAARQFPASVVWPVLMPTVPG